MWTKYDHISSVIIIDGWGLQCSAQTADRQQF